MVQKVKKALIAAAGLGSRMYPYTKEQSKLFLQIINKPMVEYLVEEFAASGIEEVVIVSNHTSLIKRFFSRDKELEDMLSKLEKEKEIERFHHIEKMCDIKLIRQEKPMGWMHEVWNARKKLKDAPFVVCFSDVLYKSEVPAAKQVIDEFDKTNKNIRGQARFLFKPYVFDILKDERYRIGKYNVDLDVFDSLRERDDLINFDIKGKFFDIGDPLSYMKTETAFALDDPNIGKDYKEFLKKIIK